MPAPKVATKTLRELSGPGAVLSNEDALALITYCEIGKKPVLALLNLMARRDEVVERLLAEIALSPAEVDRRLKAVPDERHAYFLHSFAVYLLALWKETRAYRPLVAYLAGDTHLAADQLQDMVTEDLHTILARVYDGSDLAPLKAIIEDVAAEPYVRDACLKSLHAMAHLGKLPRDEVVAYYARVLDERRGGHNRGWAECIVLAASELQEPALRPAIDQWFQEGLVDDFLVNTKDIDRTYRELPGVIAEELLQAARYDGLLDYLCGWAWFNSDNPADFDDAFEGPGEAGEAGDEAFRRMVLQPMVRSSPKVGRNEPCPCGSGRKYKKCCLA